MVALLVVTAEVLKPPGAAHEVPEVMVKFVLEISKKIFPTASTFILAVVVGVFGIVTTSLPSFGALADKTVGKVCPPSVDRDIFTFVQLIGATFVLFTLQVIVCDEPPAQDTAVLGAVTAKGPAVPFTVTTISVN